MSSFRTFTCPPPREHAPHRPLSHELWRLHGATDDLRGLAVETSFGYALALELAGEVILLHLQPSLEVLVAHAHRLENTLRSNGWQSPPHVPISHKETQ
jgi:hypothetical protein